MMGIGIDTILSGMVGVVALVGVVEVEALVGASVVALEVVCRGDVDEDEKRLVLHERLLRKKQRKDTNLLVFENMFVCVVFGTGFGGGAAFAACVAGLEVLAEVIAFLIAPIADVPAAEALAFTFEADVLGKGFGAAGLDWDAAAGEQLWSAGYRCEGQN
jgi:hypothetical protein